MLREQRPHPGVSELSRERYEGSWHANLRAPAAIGLRPSRRCTGSRACSSLAALEGFVTKVAATLNDELRKAKKEAAETYAASLMSNSKWRALFDALRASEVKVEGIVVKFIGDDREHLSSLPGLYPPHAFIDLQPFHILPLVDIEWIEFRRIVRVKRPDNVPDGLVPQDTDVIRAAIEATGKRYPIEETELGFRVVGHVK